ncbi:uncharacterized protein [Ptychodera flava]|uniref:uncharacterized protein n=1 Tax=Ptychodera flava TaxID=63121 RepID=UPI00396A1348
MDETSPGKNRPDDVQLVAAVKREPSRMDTLLATLQRDIKTLCQQGDLVSQKVLHLYQTFEGVIHEATSISPRDAPTKLDDEDVAGDEDSGVAMATSEFQDVCSSDSRGNSKQASDSAVDDGKSSTLAWYEIEEDENDIETEVDDFTPKKLPETG